MISQKVNELADIVCGTQYVSASMWFWICVSIFIQSNRHSFFWILYCGLGLLCVSVCVCVCLHAENVSGFSFASNVNTDQINIPKSNANYSFAI